MKKILCIILAALLFRVPVFAESEAITQPVSSENGSFTPLQTLIETDASSVILIEASTGAVLYEKNSDTPLPPASVTKVMTMLLVMEAIDSGKISYEDSVTVSANAASMGGSQVYLEIGEQMSVHELLKCVVVSSANDACVALAEYIAGSEEGFVALMNQRAQELGMKNTNFENTNGLDDDTKNHVISARDIAIMSAELITKHPRILEYSSIWMDSIRGGSFGLTNTNRLIRFYNGANGLKTGSTSKAKFCISASAKRGDMQLICVVMGAQSRDSRNETAKKLFDSGFANYAYESFSGADTLGVAKLPITGAIESEIPLVTEPFSCVVDKSNAPKITSEVSLPKSLAAPIKAGQQVGKITYLVDGKILAEVPISAAVTCERITFWQLLQRLVCQTLY